MASLTSLRSLPVGLNRMSHGGGDDFRRMSSYSGLSGFSSLSTSPEILEEINLSADEIRQLRIDNQELRAADHRQKAEICELRAKIIALNGQLSKCRQLALTLRSYVK